MAHICLEQGNTNQAIFNVQRARQSQIEGYSLASFSAIGGIANLLDKNFYSAANYFLSIDPESAGKLEDLLSAEDVALYGTLCAFASFSRDELVAHVSSEQTVIL